MKLILPRTNWYKWEVRPMHLINIVRKHPSLKDPLYLFCFQLSKPVHNSALASVKYSQGIPFVSHKSPTSPKRKVQEKSHLGVSLRGPAWQCLPERRIHEVSSSFQSQSFLRPTHTKSRKTDLSQMKTDRWCLKRDFHRKQREFLPQIWKWNFSPQSIFC